MVTYFPKQVRVKILQNINTMKKQEKYTRPSVSIDTILLEMDIIQSSGTLTPGNGEPDNFTPEITDWIEEKETIHLNF